MDHGYWPIASADARCQWVRDERQASLRPYSSLARNRPPDPVAPCCFGRIANSDAAKDSWFAPRGNPKKSNCTVLGPQDAKSCKFESVHAAKNLPHQSVTRYSWLTILSEWLSSNYECNAYTIPWEKKVNRMAWSRESKCEMKLARKLEMIRLPQTGDWRCLN